MMRFKRETYVNCFGEVKNSGSYYFENKNNMYLAGCMDWEICHIYKNDGGWGWSLDNSMTKGRFKTLKEAREYFA